MKLVCYIKESHEQLAMLVNDTLYDMEVLHPELPSTMSMFLNYWEDYFPMAKAINESLQQGKISLNKGISLESANLISPVPLPAACVDIYAFNGNADEPREYPTFYFTNHHSVQGAGEIICMPDNLKKLDFEFGIATVICAHGRNIIAGEADQYIGGYLIQNRIITRFPGTSDTYLNLSRDVAIVLGPWLVTPDELEPFKVPPNEGHTGNNYNLVMQCRVNGEQIIESNIADMNWTFAEIVQSCAYGADIQPGDIIGSGQAGARSFLDLNTSGKLNDPVYSDKWLQAGDILEIEIEGLGISTSTIVAEESEFSLTIVH